MLKHFLLYFSVFIFSINIFAQTQDLDYYISMGLKNSPIWNDFRNQIELNAVDSLRSIAAYKPHVDFTVQGMYAPSYSKWGYDNAITNGGNYSSLLSVAQPLFNKKLKSGQFRDLSLSSQSVRVKEKISELDVKKAITAQYITAYIDFSQLQFNEKVLQMLKDEQTILGQLVDKGIYLQTDYMNLQVSIKAQEILRKQTFIQYKNDLVALRILSGIADTSTIALEKPVVKLENNFDISASPYVLQFKIDSLKFINNKYLSSLNYKPRFSLLADAGFQSVDPRNIPYNFGASVGFKFVLPIYDGKLRNLEYKKNDILENTRTKYRDFYSTQYQQQLGQLQEQLRLTEDLSKDIKEQITSHEKLIELYKLEINKGLVRFIDFLTIINNYITTQNSLTQAELNQLQLVNQLNYLK